MVGQDGSGEVRTGKKYIKTTEFVLICVTLFQFVCLCFNLFDFVQLTQLCTNFVLVLIFPRENSLPTVIPQYFPNISKLSCVDL